MNKKQKIIIPDVHVRGNLQDARNFISFLGKKKSMIILKEEGNETYFSQKKRKIKQIGQEEIDILQKDHKLIFVSFLPDQKPEESIAAEVKEVREEVLPENEAEMLEIESKDTEKKKNIKKSRKTKKSRKSIKGKKKAKKNK